MDPETKLIIVGVLMYSAGGVSANRHWTSWIGFVICVLFGFFANKIINWIKHD